MHALDLLTPWLTLTSVLLPLWYLERWIHQHLYGVGWLLFKDKERATVLYYLILLPGVFLHEFTQWLVAGALNVRIKRVMVWPKPQSNGTLRLDFVQVQKTDQFRAAIIGMVPLLSGIALVLFISRSVFDAHHLADAFATGDLPTVLRGLEQFFSTPDFWLWLYLLFAIGNGMVPTPYDRQSWPFLLGTVGALALFLVIIGLDQEVLVPALQGPIAQALRILVAACSTILVLDCFVVLGLALLEKVLEKVTGEQVQYQPRRRPAPKPEPGGEIPLPADQTPLRITERRLPIPPPPKRSRRRKKQATELQARTLEAPARPAIAPPDRDEAEAKPAWQREREAWQIGGGEESEDDLPDWRRDYAETEEEGEETEEAAGSLVEEDLETSEEDEEDGGGMDLRYEEMEDSP